MNHLQKKENKVRILVTRKWQMGKKVSIYHVFQGKDNKGIFATMIEAKTHKGELINE